MKWSLLEWYRNRALTKSDRKRIRHTHISEQFASITSVIQKIGDSQNQSTEIDVTSTTAKWKRNTNRKQRKTSRGTKVRIRQSEGEYITTPTINNYVGEDRERQMLHYRDYNTVR